MARILSTIPKSPWKRPLNWNLHITHDGEPRTPFAFYVLPEPTHSSCSTFPQFRKLPAELQLQVLGFCDAPTLFQLMQVSSVTRPEAKKIFWSYPDAWYHVHSDWLLAGGFPGHAHHTIDILPYVEQIEVQFEIMDDLCRDWEAEILAGDNAVPSRSAEELIRDFWQTLQNQFPRATRVVVSERKPRKASESPPHHLKVMIEMCPATITASASLLQFHVNWRLERSLWQLRTEGDASSIAWKWEKMTPVWTRQSILLPAKEFSGPVGAYERMLYNFERFCSQEWAVRFLLIEARERHHFDGRCEPFDCFDPECEARFERPGEWASHAIDTSHDDKGQDMFVPDEVKALFDQHNKKLKHMKQHDVEGACDRMFEIWGVKGTEKRHHAEQTFLYQLDNDPLYAHGKPARETETWSTYTRFMNR